MVLPKKAENNQMGVRGAKLFERRRKTVPDEQSEKE